jgi:hypothetical protein
MVDSGGGKPSKHGRSQEIGGPFDVKVWFAKLDKYLDEPFMPDGRQQPPNPAPRDLFRE